MVGGSLACRGRAAFLKCRALPARVNHVGNWNHWHRLGSWRVACGPLYREKGLSLQTAEDHELYVLVHDVARAQPGEVYATLKAAIALRGLPLDAAMATHVTNLTCDVAHDAAAGAPVGVMAGAQLDALRGAFEDLNFGLGAVGAVGTYVTLMGAYGTAGRLARVVALADELMAATAGDGASGVVVLRAAIAAASAAGGIVPALGFVAALRARGEGLLGRDASCLLRACAACRDWDTGEAVLCAMTTAGLGPSAAHGAYAQLIAAWAGSGMVRRAIRGMRDLEADASILAPHLITPWPTRRSLLRAAAAAGDVETALIGWEDARSAAQPPAKCYQLGGTCFEGDGDGRCHCAFLLDGSTRDEVTIMVVAWLRALKCAFAAGQHLAAPEWSLCGDPGAIATAHALLTGGLGGPTCACFLSAESPCDVRLAAATWGVGALGAVRGETTALRDWLLGDPGPDLMTVRAITRNSASFFGQGHARLPG